jgi:cell division protein FtsQ
MNRFKRLLRPLGIGAAVLAVVIALGFVERTADRTLIADIAVRVKDAEGMHFVDEQLIRAEVADQGTAVMGASLGDVDLPAIERRLRNLPSVAEAEVYHTMDGVLHISVRQRIPVVRVFNLDGTSFYIDENGFTMPTSSRYTARVPVVTGNLQEPGATDGVRSVFESDSVMFRYRSDDIHRLAMFLREDPFWNALVDQVVVNASGEFELVPKVGAQRVLIGSGTELEQRFDKLRIFYERGITQADWRRYSRIDLRFADQIVCTKRTTP